MLFPTYVADTPVNVHFTMTDDGIHIDSITSYHGDLTRTTELIEDLTALIMAEHVIPTANSLGITVPLSSE